MSFFKYKKLLSPLKSLSHAIDSVPYNFDDVEKRFLQIPVNDDTIDKLWKYHYKAAHRVQLEINQNTELPVSKKYIETYVFHKLCSEIRTIEISGRFDINIEDLILQLKETIEDQSQIKVWKGSEKIQLTIHQISYLEKWALATMKADDLSKSICCLPC